MALRTRMDLRQTQDLALSAQMRVALSVLRMSPLELAEEIAREAAHNPFLLHDATPSHSAPQAWAGEVTAHEASLHVSLTRQLAMMDLPPRVEAAAQLLVGELREDGMLDVALGNLATELGLPVELLETALAALQRCEPAGVGARDLPESLRLQLTDKGLSPTEAAQTVTHMRLFIQREWAAINRVLALPRAQAEKRAALVHSLSTHPAAVPQAVETLSRPDLQLERTSGGALSVTLTRERPIVVLDEALVKRASTDGFAPELLARARALLAALDQRGQTLQRIGDWLLEYQAGFFTSGLAALAPLTRAALASALSLHPSTISRAVAGKSIDVDGRLWPLSVFFSAAIPTQGPEISARQVQTRISALITAEPRERPLSDEALVQHLNAEGVDIARRTVAKYRQGLRIPSSAVRRRRAMNRRQP